jgi:hypothetical protein
MLDTIVKSRDGAERWGCDEHSAGYVMAVFRRFQSAIALLWEGDNTHQSQLRQLMSRQELSGKGWEPFSFQDRRDLGEVTAWLCE